MENRAIENECAPEREERHARQPGTNAHGAVDIGVGGHDIPVASKTDEVAGGDVALDAPCREA